MYHSLYLYNGYQKINTWDDWHLIPTTRPVISLPEKKTNFIDIPGGNSSLDISNILTNGENTYNDREGEIEFYVSNEDDWDIIINKINNFFQHSNTFRCMLEDNYYGNKPYTETGRLRNLTPMYVGNMWVENYDSTNDGSHSTISIKYRFEPFWIATADDSLTPMIHSEIYHEVIPQGTPGGYIHLRDFLSNILTYDPVGLDPYDFTLSMPVAITFMPIASSTNGAQSYGATTTRGRIIDQFMIDYELGIQVDNVKRHGLNPCRIASPINSIADQHEDDYEYLYEHELIFKSSPQAFGNYYPGLLFTRDDLSNSFLNSPTILVNNIDLASGEVTNFDYGGWFTSDVYISAYFGGI